MTSATDLVRVQRPFRSVATNDLLRLSENHDARCPSLYTPDLPIEKADMPEPQPERSFPSLLEAELARLGKKPGKLRFRPGQVIFRAGDDGDGIYIVISGCVEISFDATGHPRRILSRLGPKAVFGELAVVDEQSRSATATAAVETRAFFVPKVEVWDLIGGSPGLLVSLMREIIQRMRMSEKRSFEEAFQAERLALLGRFTQSIVHALKNPLNTIMMAAHVATADDSTPDHRQEAHGVIQKQVNRLADMISEVLEFTRDKPRAINLMPVSFREFVRQVIGDALIGMDERSITIACDREPPDVAVLLDTKRLPHVFHNLIGNAVDAMPSGGAITLRFHTTRSNVTVDIKDTGPGIPAGILPRLFEPFATFGKAHGTGLGLSICKRIVEDHDGRIWARNLPEAGAAFSFTLQRQQKDDAASDGAIGKKRKRARDSR